MAAKKSAKRAAKKPVKAKARGAQGSAKTSARADKGDVVYSDLRRDALAWQLSRLR